MPPPSTASEGRTLYTAPEGRTPYTAPEGRTRQDERPSTPRADPRSLRALRSSAAIGMGSVTGFLVSVAVVPLTIGQLGTERFGLLMAAMAGVALLEPLDLGVGSALLSILAGSGRQADERRAAAITAAFRVLLGLALALGLIAVVIGPHLDWASLFNVRGGSAIDEVGPTVAILLSAFCLGLPLGLVDRVHLGLEVGHRTGATATAGNLLSLVGVSALATMDAGVPALAAALCLGPLAARAAATVVLFARHRPDLWRPGLAIPTTMWSELARTAGLFLGLQLAVAVAFSSDQLVIAALLGAEAVPEYSVPARLFALVSVGTAVLVRPLWPAYAAAAVAGDGEWIRRTLRRSVTLSAVGSAALVVPFALAGSTVLASFGRDQVHPSGGVVAGLAVWAVLSAVGSTVGALLNGLAIVRTQLVASGVMATVNVVLSVVLAQRIGVAGVVWGSVVAYTTCIVLPYLVLVPRLVEARTAGRAS